MSTHDESHGDDRVVSDKARIRIAAAVTGIFIAGLSAAGLATRDHGPQTHGVTAAQPATTTPFAAPAPNIRSAAEEGGVSARREPGDEELEGDE